MNALERLDAETIEISNRLFHEARYYFASSRAARRRILDVACGIGYGSEILFRAGARIVTGVDYSIDAISQASARQSPGRSISFVRADAVALPFATGSFDLIVTFETIEHLSDPKCFLRECARCLGHDGLLLLSTPNADAIPAGLKHSPYHIREFNLTDLESQLIEHFSEIELFWQAWPVHAIKEQRVAWLSADLHRFPGGALLHRWLPKQLRRTARHLLTGFGRSKPGHENFANTVLPLSQLRDQRDACVYVAVCHRPKSVAKPIGKRNEKIASLGT